MHLPRPRCEASFRFSPPPTSPLTFPYFFARPQHAPLSAELFALNAELESLGGGAARIGRAVVTCRLSPRVQGQGGTPPIVRIEREAHSPSAVVGAGPPAARPILRTPRAQKRSQQFRTSHQKLSLQFPSHCYDQNPV